MAGTDEVFPKAPLIEVAYEVRFPSLFYIPQEIGAFQLKIMDDYPKASQLLSTQIAIEDGVPKVVGEAGGKATSSWLFQSENEKTKVTVKLDRLSISSSEYNSYDHPSGKKFRDVINKIVTEFLQIFPIKKFTRIGLRYIDHCPLDEKSNEYFTNYYVPVFDVNKYKIDDMIENHIVMRMTKGDYNLLFQCKIAKINEFYKYILDFDSYAINIDSTDFLTVTDDLRRLDRSEFLSNITENFRIYMRGE